MLLHRASFVIAIVMVVVSCGGDEAGPGGTQPDAGMPDADVDAGAAEAACNPLTTWDGWEPQGTLLGFEELGTWGDTELGMALDYWGGSALATEHMPESKVYRIRYETQAPEGELREVTGLATIPVTGAEVPILAWQHGTTGVADACAPSAIVMYGVEGVAAAQAAGWMAHGYATVLTDYVGLGTDGVHPYIVSEAEGASVIDGLRALRALADQVEVATLSDIVLLAGHSQGGHATLAAHEMMPSYGPEFDYRAALPESPGSELVTITLWSMDHPNEWAASYGALLFDSWSEYYGFSLDPIFQDPWRREIPQWTATECLDVLVSHFMPVPGVAELFGPGITSTEIAELFERNSPRACSGVPIRLQVGTDDLMIPTVATDELKRRLCENGSVVEEVVYRGDHGASSFGQSSVDAVLWTDRILAGEPPVDMCGDWN